ncbi:unnamed protein product [Dibothriocephalus latus]|uniref:Uncharacterized protein n=1 Tax=Dibothriocephalus latus TaxID=60516 RepID=A0A3P7RFE8_DIBLA|nr:unnamed protein product [Dibothriocephalus latus]
MGPSTMSALIILAVIGAMAVVRCVFSFLRPIITYFLLRHFLSKRADLKKAGDWAIVTGSTDGIGKAFAHELARSGLNVFLISRSTEKLMKVANEIESQFKVETKIFTADFTTVSYLYKIIKLLLLPRYRTWRVGTTYSLLPVDYLFKLPRVHAKGQC